MKEKKVTVKKATKKVVKTTNISSEEMKDKTLQELKKAADKSFKTKCVNKKKIIGATLGALGLAAIGTVTPIIVYNANKEISVLVQSVNVSADKYKVKVKQGTKIKDLKIVELEGYEFVGYFKDEACTKPYKLTEELKKATTIYASYKLKELKVVIADKIESFPLTSNVTIGDAIKNIETLPYETSGVVYLDEACTLEADLNSIMTSSTTLYTKAATLDKLSFSWDNTTSSWSVAGEVNYHYYGGYSEERLAKGEVVIPESYKNQEYIGKVTKITGGAFRECNELISIYIPNSVTTIGGNAFYHCDSLTSITVGNSVTTIGDYAFCNCDSLTSITVGNSITSIGMCVFSGCSSLTSITIPNSVTTIGFSAFSRCSSLTSITIPNSVTKIGNEAFSDCNKLKTFIIDSVTIANSLNDNYWYHCSMIQYVTSVYIKSGLDTSNSTYLTSNFTKQASSGKEGYDMWVKNS